MKIRYRKKWRLKLWIGKECIKWLIHCGIGNENVTQNSKNGRKIIFELRLSNININHTNMHTYSDPISEEIFSEWYCTFERSFFHSPIWDFNTFKMVPISRVLICNINRRFHIWIKKKTCVYQTWHWPHSWH